MPQRLRARRITFWLLTGGILLSAAAVATKWKVLAGVALLTVLWQQQEMQAAIEVPPPWVTARPLEMVSSDTFRVPAESLEPLRVRTVEVVQAPCPEPLRLNGSLQLCPNRLVHAHSRFAGEVISLGEVDEPDPDGPRTEAVAEGPSRLNPPQKRPLRYGDRVTKGQVLARIWSKDVGEKKSELADALSKLVLDQGLLARFEQVEKGGLAKRIIYEARRNVEADLIAVNRAERTLLSWRLSDDEIAEIHREAELLHARKEAGDEEIADKNWAKIEVRAPMDGMILEKNVTVGDIVDTSQVLFLIADISQIEVLANAYEEDMAMIRRLPPSQRQWKIDLKSNPVDQPIPGTFDVISSVIDPQQHTGEVIGWLDNQEANLAAGQFITATIDFPADLRVVSIPTSAILQEGEETSVFVEIDSSRHEFTRRRIAILRRGRASTHVLCDPSPEERESGLESLHVGERVLISRGRDLASAVGALKLGGSTAGESR